MGYLFFQKLIQFLEEVKVEYYYIIFPLGWCAGSFVADMCLVCLMSWLFLMNGLEARFCDSYAGSPMYRGSPIQEYSYIGDPVYMGSPMCVPLWQRIPYKKGIPVQGNLHIRRHLNGGLPKRGPSFENGPLLMHPSAQEGSWYHLGLLMCDWPRTQHFSAGPTQRSVEHILRPPLACDYSAFSPVHVSTTTTPTRAIVSRRVPRDWEDHLRGTWR